MFLASLLDVQRLGDVHEGDGDFALAAGGEIHFHKFLNPLSDIQMLRHVLKRAREIVSFTLRCVPGLFALSSLSQKSEL